MNSSTNQKQKEYSFDILLSSKKATKQKSKIKVFNNPKNIKIKNTLCNQNLFSTNCLSKGFRHEKKPEYLTRLSNNSFDNKKIIKDVEILKGVITTLSNDARRLSTEMKKLKNNSSRSKLDEDKLSWEIHFINSNIKKLSNDKKGLLKELNKVSENYVDTSYNRKIIKDLCVKKECIPQFNKKLERPGFDKTVEEPGHNRKVRPKNNVLKFDCNFSDSLKSRINSRKLSFEKRRRAICRNDLDSKILKHKDSEKKKKAVDKTNREKMKYSNNSMEVNSLKTKKEYFKILEKNKELKELFFNVKKIVQYIDSLKENKSQSCCSEKINIYDHNNIKQSKCALPKKSRSKTSKNEKDKLSKKKSASCASNSIYNGPMSEYIEQVSGSIDKLSNNLDKILTNLGIERPGNNKQYRTTENCDKCYSNSKAVLDLIFNVIKFTKTPKGMRKSEGNLISSVLEKLLKNIHGTSLRLQTSVENKNSCKNNLKSFLTKSDSEDETNVNLGQTFENSLDKKHQKLVNEHIKISSISVQPKQRCYNSNISKSQVNTNETMSNKISMIVNWLSKFIRSTVSTVSEDKLLNYKSIDTKHEHKNENNMKIVKIEISPNSSNIDSNSFVYNSNAKIIKLKTPKKCCKNSKCKSNENKKSNIKVELIPNQSFLNDYKKHRLKRKIDTRRLQVKLSFSEIESNS